MSVTWRYRLAGPWLKVYHLVGRWTPTPPGAFRILNFHHIPRAHDDALRRLLKYLLDAHGILEPAEAESRLAGRVQSSEGGRIPCLLTFDDGFSSQRRVAAEILEPLGVKGVFFLCPGLMDAPFQRQAQVISRHIFAGAVASSELPPDLALMSWDEAGSLAAADHTIGSHTWSHRRLTGLGNGDRVRELAEAKRLLEARLGIQIAWFAYPFGYVNYIDIPSLKAVAREYRFCASGIRGLNSAMTNSLGLFREEIGLSSPFDYQKLVLTGGLDFLYQLRRQRLQQMLRDSGVSAGRS
jgi:peptidoglycan/xylan/chitin deacetylase (PgdA/CDA1 family)